MNNKKIPNSCRVRKHHAQKPRNKIEKGGLKEKKYYENFLGLFLNFFY